jgi:hypothetical protein
MNFSSPSRLGWCLRSNSITLSIAARLGSDHQLTCSKPAVHQYPLLAVTLSSPTDREYPLTPCKADLQQGRAGRRAGSPHGTHATPVGSSLAPV